jgi:hypothetical protein
MSIMSTTGGFQNGASTFVNITHEFRGEGDCVPRVESFVAPLQTWSGPNLVEKVYTYQL